MNAVSFLTVQLTVYFKDGIKILEFLKFILCIHIDVIYSVQYLLRCKMLKKFLQSSLVLDTCNVTLIFANANDVANINGFYHLPSV